ncbi:efflux RND transporter permease subunit [Chitinophaga nivalis]|uniref:Efflux RND transporter permease subunit n=1 Tax=Chitinophaga nivalis TaxID=2991709 RepID=A0ABT3IGS4_9BACT|nr:efflux RND transporter permease subunit [Chitinophaga nivalis]MCW3467159.1 efflux RND transporter permease subunit [Chitinophaga nivalis]MCW3483149.1 efflux RND transporter permease subunit [Chitinophaga nivalis]
MLSKIIQRPVLATVISVILVILGLVGLSRLPITQFPDIAPPSVMVSATFPGGNAATVLRSVVTPLEEAINGVENMTYIQSNASNDGSAIINVYFKLGTDPDQAAVNVQNRVAQVTSQMPAEVIQAGITTTKQQSGMIMILDVYSEDAKKYDEAFLQNFTKINVIPELKRIPGVGQAQIFGMKDYSMRVWLNPAKMTAYNVTPGEVMAAIRDQSLEAAPGKFGEGSEEALSYVINYKGKFNQPEQFEKIVIRVAPDGSVLYLKDVARIELGAASYATDNRVNGNEAVTMAIFQTNGSNANEIQSTISKVMDQASKTFPKGVKYQVTMSTKEQLDESIAQVKHTLIEAFILVFVIVFLFLQDFRSTLIPAIAVPVSLVGTFFFLQLLGFSINMLTLFALVLAIGIVVDDAIVVVEAVHSKMERTHMPARSATLSAMSEITGAIVSITLVMAAVFLPVGFMEGPTGVFYRQFAFTLAIAILISALNALTLSPALCALFLKNTHAGEGEDAHKPVKAGFSRRFFTAFNAGFNAMTSRYTRAIKWLIRFKWISLGGLAAIIAVTVWLMNSTPKGFIPNEDGSFVAYSLALPPGAGLDRTSAVLKRADSILKKFPAVQSATNISGYNILSNGASPAYAMGFMKLKPIRERGEIQNIDEIVAVLSEQLNTIKEGTFSVFTFPTVPGFGNFNGLELVLQDRTGGRVEVFSETANRFIGELMQRKEIAVAFTMFKADFPQYEVQVDAVKAKQLGVSVSDLMGTLQTYYGSNQASDFNRFGKYYRVMVQAEATARNTPESLENIFVKNDQGQMVPANSIVTLKKIYGPEMMNRYNLFNSISINAMPKPGFSTGDAMKAVEEVAASKLPTGFSYEWTGLSKEEKSAGNQMVLIFGLALVFVYFLLAAQYESYLLPLAVLLSIPTGILGVFLAIRIAGIDNNIYVQVGLVMLIGLLAKNAILIIEFAVQRRRAGKTLLSAAVEAARLRLRPIIMTSLAFVAGLIPLMVVKGSSALGNHSISIGTAGGMLSGVILGVFIIPVLFIVFQYLQEKVSIKKPVVAATEPEMSVMHP